MRVNITQHHFTDPASLSSTSLFFPNSSFGADSPTHGLIRLTLRTQTGHTIYKLSDVIQIHAVGGKDHACSLSQTNPSSLPAKPQKACLHRHNLTFKVFKKCVASVCVCLTRFECGIKAVFEIAYCYNFCIIIELRSVLH